MPAATGSPAAASARTIRAAVDRCGNDPRGCSRLVNACSSSLGRRDSEEVRDRLGQRSFRRQAELGLIDRAEGVVDQAGAAERILDPPAQGEFGPVPAAAGDRGGGAERDRDADAVRVTAAEQREAVVLDRDLGLDAQVGPEHVAPQFLVLRPVDPGQPECRRRELGLGLRGPGRSQGLVDEPEHLGRCFRRVGDAVDVAQPAEGPAEDGAGAVGDGGDGLGVAGVDTEEEFGHRSSRSGR